MAVWAGVAAGPRVPLLAAAAAAAAAIVLAGLAAPARRLDVMVAVLLLLAGMASGAAAARRADATMSASLPDGTVTIAARVTTDPVVGRYGTSFTVEPTHLLEAGAWSEWRGPRLVVDGEAAVAAGERVVIAGRLRAAPGVYRGDPVAGRIVAADVVVSGPGSDPLLLAGNAIRQRIAASLARYRGRSESALLAGFLIGDVRALPSADGEALRRAGLSHFVAVSGSNVALFLAGWWLLTVPITPGPRTRAALGLAGIVLFAVVTRFEPSVVRASAMAGIILGGRLAGFAVGGWTALGWAVSGLLLAAGDLAGDVGFQLSAAATAGVLAGSRLWIDRRPRWVWVALAATVSAQVAVAPLLLVVFGSLPLVAPLTNVIAAPLVGTATAVGGVGVLTGARPFIDIGLATARAVLAIARATAALPQLGGVPAVALTGLAMSTRWRRLRPAAAVVAGAALLSLGLGGARAPGGPEVTVLDVGQGDSILLRDQTGTVILVDGGPDPAILRDALRDRGIRRIDLLILTHPHADHMSGLVGLTSLVPVARVWHQGPLDDGPVREVLAEAFGSGAVVEVPEPGWAARIGLFDLEVLGPLRRYASPNDGSLVVRASAAGRSVLLAGDIETFAQADLGPQPADVLKVPHQGAATSDLAWLEGSAPAVAVISVGPNEYGHPSDAVIEVLQSAGSVIFRTDRDGDVVIRLDRM